MPRVLHVYKDYYPPVMGGIEKHINLLCRRMKDEFEPRVLVANTKRGTIREQVDGVEVVRATCWGRFSSAPACPSFPHLLREWPADILHFHHPNPTGDLSWLISRPPGKIIVTYHSDIVRQRWSMMVYGPFLRSFLNRVDLILPTSPHYITSSPWLRTVSKKCFPVPLGVDLELFSETSDRKTQAAEIRRKYSEPIIIFVGRLRYYKGLHFLIEAMQRLDATCLIIGDGPERLNLEKQVYRLGLTEKVLFLGELDDSDVAAHLNASDIFCLPSHLRSEAYGLCQIEAMACGLPVISTRLDTGVPFVNLHGETGLTCTPGSSEALLATLRLLTDDPDERRRLGENGRKRAREHFTANRMIERVKEVYHAALEERRPVGLL